MLLPKQGLRGLGRDLRRRRHGCGPHRPPAPSLPRRLDPRQQLPHAQPHRPLPRPHTHPGRRGISTKAKPEAPGDADALRLVTPFRVGHFQSPEMGHFQWPLTPSSPGLIDRARIRPLPRIHRGPAAAGGTVPARSGCAQRKRPPLWSGRIAVTRRAAWSGGPGTRTRKGLRPAVFKFEPSVFASRRLLSMSLPLLGLYAFLALARIRHFSPFFAFPFPFRSRSRGAGTGVRFRANCSAGKRAPR